jgi:hypothetical protein
MSGADVPAVTHTELAAKALRRPRAGVSMGHGGRTVRTLRQSCQISWRCCQFDSGRLAA